MLKTVGFQNKRFKHRQDTIVCARQASHSGHNDKT